MESVPRLKFNNIVCRNSEVIEFREIESGFGHKLCFEGNTVCVYKHSYVIFITKNIAKLIGSEYNLGEKLSAFFSNTYSRHIRTIPRLDLIVSTKHLRLKENNEKRLNLLLQQIDDISPISRLALKEDGETYTFIKHWKNELHTHRLERNNIQFKSNDGHFFMRVQIKLGSDIYPATVILSLLDLTAWKILKLIENNFL